MTAPLGIRTHNPMNVGPVPLPSMWEGQIAVRPEDGCSAFGTDADGLRAGYKNLYNYKAKREIKTIQSMSAQWAPANATNVVAGRPNDPLEHARAVAEGSGIPMDIVLDFTDQRTNFLVGKGIIYAEEGNSSPGIPWFTDEILQAAQNDTGLWAD